MKWKLTDNERANLFERHHQERDKRICDRIKAVLAYINRALIKAHI